MDESGRFGLQLTRTAGPWAGRSQVSEQLTAHRVVEVGRWQPVEDVCEQAFGSLASRRVADGPREISLLIRGERRREVHPGQHRSRGEPALSEVPPGDVGRVV